MSTTPLSTFSLPANDALVQFAELAREIGCPRDLRGQPLPVYLRNEADPAVRALRQHTQFNALLARHEHGRFDTAHMNLLRTFAQILPEQNMQNRDFHSGLDRLLCHLQHQAQRGAVIEPTDALDQLLFASDLHDSLPLRLFALPFPALYLHCSARAAQALTVTRDGHDIRVEGIYCFAGEENSGHSVSRTMNLIVLLNQGGISTGSVKITLNLADGEDTLLSYFASFQKTLPPDLWQWNMAIVGYVAKIALYMGLKEARVIRDNAYTANLKRLQRVSGKKQGKLMRQGSRLYDRIVVGPDHLPPAMNMDHASGPAVAPHWRRGHFRLQVHGPQNSLRKLMFIAPVLVAAERLADERDAPAPKRYGVATT